MMLIGIIYGFNINFVFVAFFLHTQGIFSSTVDYQISRGLSLPISPTPAIYSSKKLINSCISQGKSSYYDSSSYQCNQCGSNMIADMNELNAYGDPIQCTCSTGFYKVFRDCSQNPTGECIGFDCNQCVSSAHVNIQPSFPPTVSPTLPPTNIPSAFPTYDPSTPPPTRNVTARKPTALPTASTRGPSVLPSTQPPTPRTPSSLTFTSTKDKLGCMPCSPDDTLGINPASGDCLCPAGYAIVEKNAVGDYLPSKICLKCPAGTNIITTDTMISGKLYRADMYQCQSCPGLNMDLVVSGSTFSCACRPGYTLAGVSSIGTQSCILTSLYSSYKSLEQEAQLVIYSYSANQEALKSLTFLHYFAVSAARCNYFGEPGDIKACQALANLCVLQLYESSSSACTVFNSILRDRSNLQNDILSWGQGMPWLYYSDLPCLDTNFKQPMSLSSQALEFILAEYAMNGSFIQFRKLEDVFSYCSRISPYSKKGGGSSQDNSWQIFGTSSTTSLECDLPSLLLKEQYFYELFLYDSTEVDPDNPPTTDDTINLGKYFPVPVRITNIKDTGIASGGFGGSARAGSGDDPAGTDDGESSSSIPNLLFPVNFLCDYNDYTVRRFFLYDVVSGITSTSVVEEGSASQGDDVGLEDSIAGGTPIKIIPEMIRYASYIVLQVGLQTDSSIAGQIYVPVLTIEYVEIAPSSWTVPSTTTTSELSSVDSETLSIVPYEIITIYSIDFTSFLLIGRNFFIPAMIILGFIIFIRYRNWLNRRARVLSSEQMASNLNGINSRAFFEVCFLSIHSWTMMFFPFMLLIAWYCFVLFKLQQTPAFMLPPMGNYYDSTNPYYAFVANLYMMAIFQFVSVMIICYRQSTADVILIDWETSRSNKGGGTSTSEKKGGQGTAGVSVWRSILIANEWNEMQIARKSDIRFTMFFIGMILLGENLQYDATQQPILGDKSEGEINIVLRFATSTWWWLFFTIGQLLWNYLLYERYISEPKAQQFIDLCTLAKISIIILDEQYHGYYLHCRSPHQFADGTMTELVEMLHREEAGLTVDRSLDGAPADIQSFEIFLASEFRTSYEKIYANLNPRTNSIRGLDGRGGIMGRRSGAGGGGASGGGGGTSGSSRNGWFTSVNTLPPERTVKAWKEMNAFLKEFIDNNFGQPGLRRTVREPTYLEKFMHFPPFLALKGQASVFFPDRYFDYTKLTFLGQELNLILLNILSFGLFELWTNSAATAMLMTYLLDCFVAWFRVWLGQSCLARTTLIDERFLI